MGKYLFKYLPSEIITNILSRLDVRTVARSKCVRKSWLDLLNSDEFAKSHLSRSAAIALVVLKPEVNSSRCRVLELEEEIDAESSHDHHYNHLTRFNFPLEVRIVGSANGMLFLRKRELSFGDLYVCNPLTREYIELDCPNEVVEKVMYGFGVSKVSGQYKVVQIVNYCYCEVYTLGTGSWRRLDEPSASFSYVSGGCGAFVNGNLYWLVLGSNLALSISCFDLETERFSKFSTPPLQVINSTHRLSVLRDCLSYCVDTSREASVVIWLMKECGDEKTWTKEYVISINRDAYSVGYVSACPVKVFKDGDILMVFDDRFLNYYSNKTKTIQRVSILDDGWHHSIDTLLFTPSFLSLKSFGMENLITF